MIMQQLCNVLVSDEAIIVRLIKFKLKKLVGNQKNNKLKQRAISLLNEEKLVEVNLCRN